MSARPPAVRIDDLADPQFPAEIQPIRDVMAELAADLVLEPEPLMAAAVDATGLDNFGDDAFRERLDVLCRALRTEAGLSAVGVTSSAGLLTQLLANRLLIEDAVSRHPEILDIEIRRPIVICGLPRTG